MTLMTVLLIIGGLLVAFMGLLMWALCWAAALGDAESERALEHRERTDDRATAWIPPLGQHVPFVTLAGQPACSCGWRPRGWWADISSAEQRAQAHAEKANTAGESVA